MQDVHDRHAPNLFAVGWRDDMMWESGNRHFGQGARLFTSREEAEKYKGNSLCDIYEYCVANPEEFVRLQNHYREYLSLLDN